MSRPAMPELLPSLNRTAVLCAFALASTAALGQTEEKDVMDKLVLTPGLKTYVNLIAKAGLVETMKAEGAITVFAPNDSAFAKLPPSFLSTLKRDKAILKRFLMFTLVSGRLESKDFKEGPVKSMEGNTFTIGMKKGLTLSKGRFVAIDDRTPNGVIHIVDTVTLPPNLVRDSARITSSGG